MTHPTLTRFQDAVDSLRPLHEITFSAFQLADPDATSNAGKAYHVGDFDTLEDACSRAAVRHKQRVMVRETDAFDGKAVMHFYVVKQRSKPTYVRVPGMAHTVRQNPLYLEHLFDLNAEDIL